MTDRKIPQNIEAEKAVLGSVLISPDTIEVMNKLNDVITENDFYRPNHKKIYLAMIDLYRQNKPIDTVTLVQHLNNNIENVGGISYITELANCVPSASSVKYYANIVRDKAIKRELINTANKIVETTYESDNIDVACDTAEKLILEVRKNHTNSNDIVEPQSRVIDMITEIEKRYNNRQEGSLSGVDTGFIDINKMTGGFQKSDLIILAARPSMGKTALALNLAVNIAYKKKIPVGFFSLEMNSRQIDERFLSQTALIDTNKLRSGDLNEKDIEKMLKAGNKMAQTPLYVDDTAGINIMQLRSKVRRLKQEKDIQVLFIDYLQLISGNKRENRQQEISEISRQLKILARELNITVVALSQLSRSVEARQDKRPMLSDLRDSGAIEQDADIVLLLYREGYYNLDSKDNGNTELIFAKHRNGETGTVNLFFHKQFCLFNNLYK